MIFGFVPVSVYPVRSSGQAYSACVSLSLARRTGPKPPSPSGTSNCKFRFKLLGWSGSRTMSFQSVACEDVPCVGSGTTYNGRCIFSKCLKHPRSPSSSNPVSLMYRILLSHHRTTPSFLGVPGVSSGCLATSHLRKSPAKCRGTPSNAHATGPSDLRSASGVRR